MAAPHVDRYAPPPPPRSTPSLLLAILVHALLIGALTWGVNWKHDPSSLTAEAELWSPTAQQAAPRPVEPPPPPPPPPAPAPPAPQPPAPAPPPPAPPPPAPTPPPPREADIAVEREQQRQAQERRQRQQEQAEREARQRREQAEREARQRQEQERQRQEQAERQRQEQAERQRAQAQRAQQERERQQQLAAQRRAAEEQRQREQAQRQREEEERQARNVAQLREENLRRIQGLAGATGRPSDTGTAERSSGPSDSYAGRIVARVRPNIVFTDDIAGNPVATVEVRMSPDGTITSRRILKSSGVKSWDEAVLRALDRTEVLPRDVDGRVHSPLEILFRPKG